MLVPSCAITEQRERGTVSTRAAQDYLNAICIQSCMTQGASQGDVSSFQSYSEQSETCLWRSQRKTFL